MRKNIKEKKARLREELKARRAALDADTRAAYSRRVTDKILSQPEVRSADNIFIYISYGSELETHTLINALLDSGKRLAAPRILDRETMIAVGFSDWASLEKAELGILRPMGSDPLTVEYDVTITPGLGFTERGYRIGYGAGYYDRWFARNQSGTRIAPAFEIQLVENLPVDEYDLPVHRILTERRDIHIAEPAQGDR